VLKRLLEICHLEDPSDNKTRFEVPFLKNLDGDSPIHLCLRYDEYRNINLFLEYMSEYGIDHHSRAIEGTLSTIVAHKIENTIPYLNSRILKTEAIAKIKKG